MEANFSNERALELTPQDLALVQGPRARRPAVATRDPSVRRAALSRRRDRRGELDGVEAVAGRRRGRRPVDDADPVRRRQDRLCRRVLDLARHLRGAGVRLQGPDALRDRLRHLGHAREAAPDLDALYPARQGRLRQARGADRAGERHVPRRARHVRGKLPQRQGATSSAPTTAMSRLRSSTPRCARSSEHGRGGAHRRRHRRRRTATLAERSRNVA